jgi:hypothetical protein
MTMRHGFDAFEQPGLQVMQGERTLLADAMGLAISLWS